MAKGNFIAKRSTLVTNTPISVGAIRVSEDRLERYLIVDIVGILGCDKELWSVLSLTNGAVFNIEGSYMEENYPYTWYEGDLK